MASGLVACAGENGDQGDEELGETAQAVTTQTGSVTSAAQSDLQALGGFNIDGFEPGTLTVFHLHVEAKGRWKANLTADLSWDADKVRQGQVLDVKRTGSANGLIGTVWELTGTLRPLDLFDVDIGTIPLAVDVGGCTPPLDGGAYHCDADSPSVTLFDGFAPTTPFVRMAIGIDYSGDGASASATRTLYLGDEAGASSDLEVNTSELGDPKAMPCDKPVGTTVDYALDPFHWKPANSKAVQQPKFVIGIHDPVFSIPITLFEAPFGPAIVTNPDFTLDGAGNSVSLGELQANNVLPTIAPLGPFSGVEGSPVSFSQSTTSACPITSYVWQFSNGTTSFGPHPQRTFGDDGLFDGQLTVTDSTSLSATGSFSVNIGNVAPVANAGPNTGGAWGTPIALNGQAVDPGSDDQSTLVYTWNYGDGTPGGGGASVAHAYAVPGDYTATLTVCDDHVCDTDTTLVHVRKRTTAVSYTGTNAGTFSAPATLMGSIVDELGQPVVGGTVAFTLAGASAGSAQTNASGNAARTVDVNLDAGAYVVSASYAGSGLYDGGNTSEAFAVVQMSSSVQYTGAASGKANKTVALSAKLVDGLGRALAGKTVVFQLGTQSVSATTSSTGVASASLKLNQHNGSYTLTTTWAPSAGDAAKWTGSTSSGTFVIGN